MVSLYLPSLGHLLEKFLFLINSVISFKVAFNQAFFVFAGNLATSKNILVTGIKCDNYDPDYNTVGNEFFNSFTTSLKTLCRPLPILLYEISSPIRSLCACRIQSHIFNIASLMLMSGCI